MKRIKTAYKMRFAAMLADGTAIGFVKLSAKITHTNFY